jgi:hypothetical protein
MLGPGAGPGGRLLGRRAQGSPFAADADLHIINVSLRDLKDTAARAALLQVRPR